MSDQTINDILKYLNEMKKSRKYIIFKNSIGGNVEFANVWIYNKKECICKNQKFFLIKNQHGKYVSAIYGMNHFHWYTIYKERGRGYLSNALKNFVIPFLWGPNRKEIHDPFEISISRGIGPKNFKSSLTLATSVGFKVKSDDGRKATLNLSFDDFTFPKNAPPKLLPRLNANSEERLKKNAHLAINYYLQVKGELEIMLGADLEDFEKITSLDRKLENLIEEFKLGKL